MDMMEDKMNVVIPELMKYVELDDTEWGGESQETEFCIHLTEAYYLAFLVASVEFIEALEKEMENQLRLYKAKWEIVTITEEIKTVSRQALQRRDKVEDG